MPRTPRRRAPKSEFDQRTVEIARVARVVAGGRRFRFRASVVIGDRKGRVGYGIAKGADVSAALTKAANGARRTMITVPMIGTTIPHDVVGKVGGAKVFLKPAPEGTGVIAGSAVRAVIEMAGIRDILSKRLGSGSKTNNMVATIAALKQLESPEMIALQRGKKIEDLSFRIGKKKLSEVAATAAPEVPVEETQE